MSKFTKPLQVEFIKNNFWKTLNVVEYHVGSYPSNEIIVVEKEFDTDFASVPRIFWPIISPIDNHPSAAVVHDYCYRINYCNNRKKCDKIFKEGLHVLKVNKAKIFIMYISVRLFGWHRWNKAKKMLRKRGNK